jgi:hypothetical protein
MENINYHDIYTPYIQILKKKKPLFALVINKVIKIPIRILKSYDFTIQHYENDSNLN